MKNFIFLLILILASNSNIKAEKETVVLLHGLARSSSSMNTMSNALQRAGYNTCNINYPSTKHNIEKLIKNYILPEIIKCQKTTTLAINFVTHSMGGIIVRYLEKEKLVTNINRVVMLSPPNKGSEVVDTLGNLWIFKFINGPAGAQLGTSGDSLPSILGSTKMNVGIITGNRTINLILSLLIPSSDDGKVSIRNARLDGAHDFIVIKATHTFIMKNKTAIEHTINFLKTGQFIKK